MTDSPVATNPKIESAIQDYASNQSAFKTDISEIIKADLGTPQQLKQDAQQLENGLRMSAADLVNLGFPATIISNDAGAAAAPGADASPANTAIVKLDAQNRPEEVDYPNGMMAKVTRDQNGQITEADISGAPDKQYDGTFKLESDGLLHEFGTNGKEEGVTVKPSDVQIASDGAVQVIAKEKVAFFDASGYIRVSPQGVPTQYEGSPPAGSFG